MNVTAIVPAAGLGKRFGSRKPKVYLGLAGVPMIVRTLRALRSGFRFREVFVCIEKKRLHEARLLLDRHGLRDVKLAPGGVTRAESVRNALDVASTASDWVLVHDAARPLVDAETVKKVIREAARTGAAICAVPVTSTVKKVDASKKTVISTEDRKFLFLAQTPQVVRRKELVARYARLGKSALRATDEAALLDGTRIKVRVVEGSARNIKVTTKDDLKLAQFYLKNEERRRKNEKEEKHRDS